MSRSERYWLSMDKKTKNKIDSLFIQYANMKGISHYGYKSDILADLIQSGLRQLIASHIPELENAHTQKETLNKNQLKHKKMQEFFDNFKDDIVELGAVMSFFFNDRLFGDDFPYYRPNLSWFNKFMTNNKLYVLNLRIFGIKKLLIVSEESKWHKQLWAHCDKYNPQWLPSLSKKMPYDVYIQSEISQKTNKNQRADRAEMVVIKWLKHELGIIPEKPMNLDPAVSQVIELRSQGKEQEACEILDNIKTNYLGELIK